MKKNNLEKIFDKLFPLNRSIMGKGFRKSLDIITGGLNFKKIKFKSGTKVFDWKIPKEWNIDDAYISDSNNKKFCEFKKNNLHIVGYSTPINKILNFKDLKKNLYFIKKLPNAIPYVTSYYKKRWGFCIKYSEFKKLKKGKYKVYINSKFTNGNLIIGEKLIKGKSKKEILFSTYLCHPSMASNELSGPLVLTELIKRIKSFKLNFTYRFVITSETIGAISYLKKRGEYFKKNLIAGYQVTCVGDKGIFNYKKTKFDNSLTNFLALKVLKNYKKNFNIIDFSPFGSDERQYNSPGFNLPIGSLMRTPYDQYKEYHTSLDNKKIINFRSMNEVIDVYKKIIFLNEKNFFIKSNYSKGEPMLSKRNLYSDLSKYNAFDRKPKEIEEAIFWILSLADDLTFLEILDKSKLDINTMKFALKLLKEKKIIKTYI